MIMCQQMVTWRGDFVSRFHIVSKKIVSCQWKKRISHVNGFFFHKVLVDLHDIRHVYLSSKKERNAHRNGFFRIRR